MSREREAQWYRISPVDGWFFGSSRPSNRGEDQSDLRSVFPPHPQTVVGGIRAALARRMGWKSGSWSDEIKRTLGDGFDDVTPLSFTAPMLSRQDITSGSNELLYPAPRHLLGVVEFDAGVNRFHPKDWLSPSRNAFETDSGEIVLPQFPDHRDKHDGSDRISRLASAERFFVTAKGMQQVIDGELPSPTELLHQDTLFTMEDRVGIDRSEDNRSMYSPGFVRLRAGVALIIGIKGLHASLEVPPLFPLGGESRLAVCERLSEPPLQAISRSGETLMLISPASFPSARWYGAGPSEPASILSESLTGNIVTCVIDRPVRIGGYDSRADRTKSLALKPCAPAGSVWWLDERMDCQECDSFSLGLRSTLGYGQAFLGQQPRRP